MSEKSNIDRKIWTLREAVYKFCDQATVKALKDALKNPTEPTGQIVKNNPRRSKKVMKIVGFDLENNQSTWVTGKRKIPRNRTQTKRDLLKPLNNKLWDEFKQLLLAGEIVSKAKKSYPTADFENLGASAWKYLKVSNRDKTIAYVSAKPNNIKYYDLQFFLPQDTSLPDQSDPPNTTGVSNVNEGVTSAVGAALKKFAPEYGYNGDGLKLHFANHGSKSKWYRDWFVKNCSDRWKEDTVTRQIESYISDETWLSSISDCKSD